MDFVGEAQMNTEATKRILGGLAQLVFISPEGIYNKSSFSQYGYVTSVPGETGRSYY